MKSIAMLTIALLLASCSTLSMVPTSIGKLARLSSAERQKVITHFDAAKDYALEYHDAGGALCYDKSAQLWRGFPALEPGMESCPACIAEHLRLVRLWRISSLHEETLAACSPFLGVIRRLVMFR